MLLPLARADATRGSWVANQNKRGPIPFLPRFTLHIEYKWDRTTFHFAQIQRRSYAKNGVLKSSGSRQRTQPSRPLVLTTDPPPDRLPEQARSSITLHENADLATLDDAHRAFERAARSFAPRLSNRAAAMRKVVQHEQARYAGDYACAGEKAGDAFPNSTLAEKRRTLDTRDRTPACCSDGGAARSLGRARSGGEGACGC